MPATPRAERRLRSVLHRPALAVGCCALLLAWPAFYNRYPLLYPDSVSYLESGAPLLRALFSGARGTSLSHRSAFYALGILPFHAGRSPWGVVLLQALLAAALLWLLVRAELGPRVGSYLALVAALAAFSGLPWHVAWVMPDLLGPLAWLAVYLLLFRADMLSRPERVLLALLACFGVTAHASHLILLCGLCLFVPALLVGARRPRAEVLGAAARLALLLGAVVAAQLGLHWHLYGAPSLGGPRPPFLLARVVGDGPGARELARRCRSEALASCNHQGLPDADAFLWGARGWITAPEEEQRRMREEEPAIVWATVRASPAEELRLSLGHFWDQLGTFDLSNYDDTAVVREQLDRALPGALRHYLESRQAEEELDDETFSALQLCCVVAALLLLAALLLRAPERWSHQRRALVALVLFCVVANAAVTGILSDVEARYQARVIWLLPLLALLFLLERRNTRDPGPPHPAAPGGA